MWACNVNCPIISVPVTSIYCTSLEHEPVQRVDMYLSAHHTTTPDRPVKLDLSTYNVWLYRLLRTSGQRHTESVEGFPIAAPRPSLCRNCASKTMASRAALGLLASSPIYLDTTEFSGEYGNICHAFRQPRASSPFFGDSSKLVSLQKYNLPARKLRGNGVVSMAKKPKKGGGAPSGGGGGSAGGKGGEGSKMKSAGSKAPSQEGAYQHETRKIILSAQKLRKVS